MPASANPPKKDFFISYNKADRAAAEWIAWQLVEGEKYTVVIQAWDFGPASNFVVEMDKAVRECDRVLAVLSPDYFTSLFTRPEWAAYFANDSEAEERRIFPVRVREFKVDGLLASLAYTDLFGKSETDAAGELLEAVRKLLVIAKTGRDKPVRPPAFFGNAPSPVATKPKFFGALPDIWNVPHLRNPSFTEPGSMLTDLRATLTAGQTAALTQAMTGLGGVGKTQLAVEYAWRFASEYDLVWWLRAEVPAALAAEYAALATALDLPEKDAPQQPVIIAAVRAALQHRRGWLLVFDNANSAAEIRPNLPGTGGHVLITSRDPAWGGVARKVEVKKWPSEVAVEFLLKRTGQADATAAAAIAHEVDHLPLALEQAAAYIEATGGTLAGYLRLFRTHALELLKRGASGADDSCMVATTWDISFQKLEAQAPAAIALLHLSAFFAPDEIPCDIITTGAEFLPEPLRTAVSDPVAFYDTILAIRRYSLLEACEKETFSIHRLVQAVIRARLPEPDQKKWAEAAVKVVNKAFPGESNDVTIWPECARLLPHALATTDFAEPLGVVLETVARLVNEIGVYALGRAEYATAKAAFERALRIDEKISGFERSDVAAHVNNLGSALQYLGDLQGAKTAYERALKIDEKIFGLENQNVAIRVSNLGSILRSLDDLPGAKAAFERALKIGEKVFGPDHPDVAVYLNNLGGVLRKLGDLTGAMAAFENALKIDKKAFGPEHPKVATRVNNLGGVLRDLGDLPGAKAAYESALKIDEKAYGKEHPKVAIRVNNLGLVLRAEGDLPGAKSAFERALTIDEKVFGPNHPSVALRVSNLGFVLYHLGDLSSARSAFERALTIYQKFLPSDHPSIKLVQKNIEILRGNLG